MDGHAAFGRRCVVGHDPTACFYLGVLETHHGIFNNLVSLINSFDFIAYWGNRAMRIDCIHKTRFRASNLHTYIISITSSCMNLAVNVSHFVLLLSQNSDTHLSDF